MVTGKSLRLQCKLATVPLTKACLSDAAKPEYSSLSPASRVRTESGGHTSHANRNRTIRQGLATIPENSAK